MNRRPAHEPSRQFRQPERLWDDATRHAPSLGCPTCLERDRCGGVHTDARILDCGDLCTCADRTKCDMVCRFNPGQFVARMQEVGGLNFNNAPRTSANGVPTLPLVVPFVDHRYGRAAILDEPVVAVSLYELVNMATGKVHVASRGELAARFLIPEAAQVVVSGVDKDRPIERWWELKDRRPILAALKDLGVALVTTPNYSVLTDVPRTDNLHAMKRILLAWNEMASAGVATALHVNARTEHDYARWAALIADREEIEILAFEFATGCGRGERIDWHVAQLCALADRVGRPLAIVVRGGGRKLNDAPAAFRASKSGRDRSLRAHHPPPEGLFDRSGPAEVGEVRDADGRADRRSVRAQCKPCPFRLRDAPPCGSRFTTAAAPPRRTADGDGEPVQPGLLRELDLAGEARGVAPEPQGVVATAKS